MSDVALKNSMSSLVNVLRELLANMEEEQHAILIQNASAFQVIMNNRSSLLNVMNDCRSTMVEEIGKLQEMHPEIPIINNEQDRLLNLAKLAGEDNVELLTLRDQILALTEKMEHQNVSNNALLGNPVLESDKREFTSV